MLRVDLVASFASEVPFSLRRDLAFAIRAPDKICLPLLIIHDSLNIARYFVVLRLSLTTQELIIFVKSLHHFFDKAVLSLLAFTTCSSTREALEVCTPICSMPFLKFYSSVVIWLNID